MERHKTATEALAGVADTDGEPVGRSSSFTCPHPDCRILAVHHWGMVRNLHVMLGAGAASTRSYDFNNGALVTALCEACKKEVIFFKGRLISPAESEAPNPSADMPEEVIADFEEARRVLPVSPRGAAALLRLLVQKLLPMLGAKEGEINAMIGELVVAGVVSTKIQKALDSVRVIGNEAVHPGTMDLRDDQATAISLFNLINYIVEKAITEPKEIDAIYAGLPPGKLAGIVNRDKAATGANPKPKTVSKGAP